MKIQPMVHQGIPSPSLLPVFDEICCAGATNELLFVLAKWMDVNFEEPTNLNCWVLVLNKLDALLEDIVNRSGCFLLLPEKREDLVAAPPPDLAEKCVFDCHALIIILRFTSLLLLNSTNKDIYMSVEHLMILLRAYDDDVSRLALECILSLATPPSTQRCLTFTNHVTQMHKNGSLCLPLFQIVEFSRSVSSFRAADFLSADFSAQPREDNLVFSMLSKSRHAQLSHQTSGSSGVEPSAAAGGDPEGKVLEISNFLEDHRSIQDILMEEVWFPIEHAFPLLTQMRTVRASSTLDGRKSALRMMYQAILILLCCHPSSATLSDFFHDKTEILMDFIYLLRTGPGTPEYDDSIPFDLRVLACQSLVAVVGSRDVSSVSVMGRFSWLQHDLGVNRGQYMGLLPCLLRSAATFLASRHDTACEYASEIAVTGEAAKIDSWNDRVAVAARRCEDGLDSASFSSMLVQTPPCGMMTVASPERIKLGIACVFRNDVVVSVATLRSWILAAQDASPVYSSDYQVHYSPVYLTRLLWIEQILILTTAVISATSALPALVDSGFISLIVGTVSDPAVRDHTDLQLSYIEATMIQMLELSISDSSVSMNIFKEMNGADTLLERLLYEINDARFSAYDPENVASSSSAQVSGSKRKHSEVAEYVQNGVSRCRSETKASTGGPSKIGPGVSYSIRDEDMVCSLRTGVHSMLPSTNVIIHSLLSAVSVYLQEGADSRLSHILRGKKFSSAMSVLFKHSRYLAPPVFAFAYSILSEVINNDPGFLGYIINNGLVKLALECCKDLDIEHVDPDLAHIDSSCIVQLSDQEPLNRMLFCRGARVATRWPDLTSELITSMTSFVSAVALTKDGLELIAGTNPFSGFFATFLDFRCYSPFSNTMMNDLPRSVGSTMEDLVRHYPVLSDKCMDALLAVMDKVASCIESSDTATFESVTKNGVAHLTYLHATSGLLQCLNQILARKTCVDYLFKGKKGVTILSRLLKVGMSAPRSFLAALASSTEPTTNVLGHHPIVKGVAQCFMAVSQHDPRQLSEQLFQFLKVESANLDDSLKTYWDKYDIEISNRSDISIERVGRVEGDKLKNFLDSIPRKRLHQCYVDGHMTPVLLQFTKVLSHFVVLNYFIENLAAVLQILSSRAQSRYSASSDPLVLPRDCEILDTIINKWYVSSQVELCAARGNLITGNKKGKPKSHPIYRLLIISHEHVVVRSAADGEPGKKIGKLPKGAIVDAYERCTVNDNSLKYRTKDGWIGFYRNNSYGDPQVEVIELLEKTPDQVELEERQAATSLDTAQKKFDFEKFANVSPRRGGFMTMFHFHCCVRHLLSVCSWSFLPPPGKPFPDQTLLLVPLITSCLSKLLPDIAYDSKIGELAPPYLAHLSTAVGDFFVRNDAPSPESFSISDSFRTIHAVELCHHLLFDEKKSHGESNILLLMHLLHDGFIDKLLHSSSLVFLTCLQHDNDGNTFDAPASIGNAAVGDLKSSPEEDGSASDCSSDADELVKRAWHEKRVLKERRMLAVTNIDIVIELWKLFFGPFSLSLRAASLLKDASDASHDFDITALRHQVYCLQVKYLFQTWSHPRLYTLPPTSVRHVLELLNIVSKTLWSVSHDGPSSGARGGLVGNVGRSGGGRLTQAHRVAPGARGMPYSLQQLLSADSFESQPGNVEGNFPLAIFGGNRRTEEIDDELNGSTRAGPMRLRTRSNSVASSGSRGRQGSLSSAAPVDVPEQPIHMPRLEHILPAVKKRSAEELNVSKELIAALSTIVYNSVSITCLELIARGIKAPGVQWRTETAITNQNLTREDSTVMALTMMSSCLEVTKWPEAVRAAVQVAYILNPILEILKSPLVASAASRLYGLLHAVVLVLAGSKFELIFLLISRSSGYAIFSELLVSHIEHQLTQLKSSPPSDSSELSKFLWVTPALLLLDSFVQPIVLDKVKLASQLREIAAFIDPTSRTKYGKEFSEIISYELVEALLVEFSPAAEDKNLKRDQSSKSTTITAPSNDLEISNFLEKHGGLEPDASVADIKTIKKSILKDDSQASSSEQVILNAQLPLFEDGIEPSLRIRCVHMCVLILELCGSPDEHAPVFVQATCQLLSHLTRERKLAEIVLSSMGIEKLLDVKNKFDGSSAFVFTLILHTLEDDHYLLHSMEATIKVCLHRMKSTPASKAQTLKAYIDTLAPLMYRNQTLFLEATKKCIVIRPTEIGQYVVSALDGTVDENVVSSTGESTACTFNPDDTLKRRCSSSVSAVAHSHGSVSTPDPALMKEILDILVQKLLEQWLSATDESGEKGPASETQCLLSIADIVTLLGDLVCTVPGFATCIHKCQYSPSSKSKSFSSRTMAFEAGFSHMKHSLTKDHLHSNSFITFLVHYLLSCDIFLGQSPIVTGTTTAAVPGSVDTKVLKDAVSYLLLALVSRPGDGRRRVLKELFGVLKLGGMSIDTIPKLKVVSSLVQCIQSIMNPKSAWKQRSLLTVPYKDIIMTVVSLKAYGILSEVLFAISIDHPLSLQVSEQISIPLEFLIRKGIPMHEEGVKVEREAAAASDDRNRAKLGLSENSSRRLSKVVGTPHGPSRGETPPGNSQGNNERPPTAPRVVGTANRRGVASHTPGSNITAANGTCSRGEYDFFSPLVSSGIVDRRDTMTTDDDRDLDRLEHHGTLENDLRLLAQPSQSSGPSGADGMMSMPTEEMEADDVDEDDDEAGLESILSSGSEEDDDDEFDEEDEDEEDEDDIVVNEDDEDFDEHTLDGEGDDESEEDVFEDMDENDQDNDGLYDANDDEEDRHGDQEMEISISFEPQSGTALTESMARAANSTSGGADDFDEDAARLVTVASGGTGGRREMRPPSRRPSDGTGRLRHSRRAYESIMDRADIDDNDDLGGYDSSYEQDEVSHAPMTHGDNDDDPIGEWITVNHGEDGGEEDEYADGDNDVVRLMNSGRTYPANSGGNRSRPRLADIMESFNAQSRGGGLGGGAVRIAGDDLMGFLGTLPIPEFLRNTIASSGGLRHMVAHIPMNGESMEHDEATMFDMSNEFHGGVREALDSLVRPNRVHNRANVREGAASNPTPLRHPLLHMPTADRTRGNASGRGRSGSFIDAIISAVEGPGRGPDLLSSEEKMKSVVTQRRRLLGSLISDRRWGTDVGDRELTSGLLGALGQSVVKFYRITEGEKVVVGASSPEACSEVEASRPKSFEEAFLSQFGRAGRASRRYGATEESKEEMDLQESKDDSESSVDDAEGSSGEDCLDDPSMLEAPGLTGAVTYEAVGVDEAHASLNADNVEAVSTDMIASDGVRTSDAHPVDSEITAPGESVVLGSVLGNHDEMTPAGGVDSSRCPDGYDPEVWELLPPEVQHEILRDELPGSRVSLEDTVMMDHTELDRSALEALPAAMRSEVLREEAVERRRRESFDQTNADSSAIISSFGSQIGADLQSTDATASRPSAAQENYLFITSLPPVLRHEALLGADEEFISSLPQSIRQEAETIRERRRHRVEIVANTAMRLNLVSSRNIDRISSATAANDGEGDNANDVYSRLYTQLLPGRAHGNAAGENESNLHPTTVFFEDERDGRPPFGPRLVSRILHYVVSGTSTRLSRVLTRLLCVLCRYRSTRLPILHALTSILLKDAQKATECLLQIPREPYKTYTIHSSADGSSSRSYSLCGISSTENDDSLLAEMNSIAAAMSRANQVQGTLCVRRLLHLMGSLVKHTDRLVWYDIMKEMARNDIAHEVKLPFCALSQFSSENAASEWMFQKLILLLGDQRVLQECDIDSVLYLLGELCEPLSRLKVDQVSSLVSKQILNSSASHLMPPSQATSDSNRSNSGTAPVTEHADDAAIEQASKRRRVDESVGGTLEVGDGNDSSHNAGTSAVTSENGSMEICKTKDLTQNVSADTARLETDQEHLDMESAEEISLPFPVLDSKSIELLAMLAKSEYCGGPGRNRLSRVMCTLSLYDGNWKQLVSSLSSAAESLIGNTEAECRTMLAVLTKVVDRNGSAADATSLPELSTPSSVSETRLLRVFRLMGSLRNSIDGSNMSPTGGSSTYEATPMTLSGTVEERSFVARHIRGINFGSLWGLLCEILNQIRGLEGISEEIINAGVGKCPVPATSVANSMSSTTVVQSVPSTVKQPFLSSLTMRFMPLIECYMTVSGATLLRARRSNAPESGSMVRSLNSFAGLDSMHTGMLPPTPSGSSGCLLRAASSMVIQKVAIPGARFRQHKSFIDMHMDLIEGPDTARFLQFVEANKSLLNMILRQNIPLLESSFSPFVLIPRLRTLLHFDIKRAYFKLKLKKLKQSAGRNFGSLRISVHRSSVMEDSFQKLRFCSAEEMRKRLSVTFLGEDGIDAGGLTREWFSLLAKEIFNVNYCLFTATDDNVTFQPNPYSGINPDHLGYFKFVGRIIGKAICDGHLLDAHFTRSFYKHMLGIPVGYQDLEALEPEYYKSLMAIIEHPLDLLGLDLTFSAELNEFGRVEIVDLIENGRSIAVTDENKSDYIRLIANHRMTNSIQKQIDSFLEGFHDTIPPELISIFDAQELELVISGLPDIDLDDLRAHTDYQGYKATDPVINHFWSALRSFSKEEKALFLQFVTGTSKVPLEGFSALYGARGPQQFNIHKAYGTHLLPCAHTCFNQLDLPEYATEEELREKLLIALHEGAEGFGFA